VEFGIFHEFECPAGRAESDAFDEALALVDAAERWGLDAVWLAEIHFSPQRSVLSAPLTIASAVAGRTERIKIGTAVQVLPLSHPLRLAEETATIDHISKGRLIFGVGRSGFATTYQTYGVPYAESRERFAETLDVVKRAWTEPSFSHSGTFFQFDNVCLVPKPYQKPHPPIRIAATSADTFPACGELGYPIFAAVRLGTLSELKPTIDAYRAAYHANGHNGSDEVFLRVPVYVGETEGEARHAPEESILSFYRMLGRQLEASAGTAGTRAVEDRAGRGQRLQSIGWDEVLRDKVIVGTPAQVAERLLELEAELGLNGILAELNCGGLIPRERVHRSLQLLCQEVMPRI
jgi:alkanesulfonate monooxygenase SsuD/methylene tetrahydromethanopterin reductase-like flavin-dependent oxidoreductase (luciferase family)